MPRYKSEIILFIVASIWAATFPVLKLTLVHFPPFYFVAIRFFIGAVVFTIFFFRGISLPTTGEIRAGVVLGILLVLGFGSQSVGLRYTSSSNSALITGVNVLVVPFVQYLITGKKVFIENWIGVVLVTIGLYLLTQPEINGINTGDWVTLICAVAWAFYIIYLDVFTNRNYNINNMIIIQFWLVAFICLAIAGATEDISKVSMTNGNILALLYTGVLATFAATTLGNKYQKFTTPIRATLVMAWETPAAVMMSLLFLNDTMIAVQYLGAVLMIVGIIFSETFDFARKNFLRRKTEAA